MDLPETMIHALSVDRKDACTAIIRGTIRYGEPIAGATLYFRDTAGAEHRVTLRERTDHGRQVELLVEGDALDSLVNGRFLYTHRDATVL